MSPNSENLVAATNPRFITQFYLENFLFTLWQPLRLFHLKKTMTETCVPKANICASMWDCRAEKSYWKLPRQSPLTWLAQKRRSLPQECDHKEPHDTPIVSGTWKTKPSRSMMRYNFKIRKNSFWHKSLWYSQELTSRADLLGFQYNSKKTSMRQCIL